MKGNSNGNRQGHNETKHIQVGGWKKETGTRTSSRDKTVVATVSVRERVINLLGEEESVKTVVPLVIAVRVHKRFFSKCGGVCYVKCGIGEIIQPI